MLERSQLGALLRASRVVHDVKQSELAASIPVSPAALSHVESGRNLPSDRVLQAYADVAVDAEVVTDFIDLLMRIGPSEIGAIADLVSPTDAKRFLVEYSKALDKTIDKPQSRPEPQHRSAPMWASASPDFGVRSNRVNFQRLTSPVVEPSFQRLESLVISQTKFEHKSVEEVLSEFVNSNGGQTLSTKTKSYEFGSGIDFRCDLVDISHRVAFEVKSVDRITSKSIIELVGKGTLLSNEGFRLVLCLTTEPVDEQSLSAVDTLRSNNVLVIWPTGLPGLAGYFHGDSVY
jgi:transcriptional regulator with XRE-family HTH domain